LNLRPLPPNESGGVHGQLCSTFAFLIKNPEMTGIAQGLLADQSPTDQEIRFLHDWLGQNDVIAARCTQHRNQSFLGLNILLHTAPAHRTPSCVR
jgi:hypothetical protein